MISIELSKLHKRYQSDKSSNFKSLDPARPVCYFVIYGPGDVQHIKNVLVPALAQQLLPNSCYLCLMNYLENKCLFPNVSKLGRVTILDFSSMRKAGQIGYGESLNLLFSIIHPYPSFFIINPDTVPKQDFSARLMNAMDLEKVGIAEGRQWPAEHPKEFDAFTGDTPWASGACLLVSSDAFAEIEGFDTAIFLYCEDVDISWRMWLSGKRVVYVRDAICEHHTGLFWYSTDRLYAEQFYSALGHLILSYKFFGEKGEKEALSIFNGTWYPNALKRLVLERYQETRRRILPRSSTNHPMVKILGFNMYHRERQ